MPGKMKHEMISGSNFQQFAPIPDPNQQWSAPTTSRRSKSTATASTFPSTASTSTSSSTAPRCASAASTAACPGPGPSGEASCASCATQDSEEASSEAIIFFLLSGQSDCQSAWKFIWKTEKRRRRI